MAEKKHGFGRGAWLSPCLQEVANVKPEHIGQLGEVLWARVAASGFPRVDVATIDAESVANGLQCEPA